MKPANATMSARDYVAKSGTLTFKPGKTTNTITIVINGDNKKETNETFYLDLFGNSSNSLFSKNRGTGTILSGHVALFGDWPPQVFVPQPS